MNSQIKVLQVIEPHKILKEVFRLDNSTTIDEITQEKNRKKIFFLLVFSFLLIFYKCISSKQLTG